MDSLQFSNPNPATGQPGTLVTTTWFQNVNDEISNVITKNGSTIDSTNSEQLYQTLQATYAPLASPSFTGTPLCPDTNSKSNGRAIVNFESMQAYVAAGQLGYTPVHQGGGVGQGNNTVYIGWSSSGDNTLKCTVDSTDHGDFAFQSWVSSNYLNLSGGNITGTFTYDGATVATKNDVNSAITTVEDWVTGEHYVSGTSSMGSGDTAATGIHYTSSSQTVQLNLADSTTIGIATQDWTGANYLASSGGTMTGDISINGHSVGQNSSGSKITFETTGHISIWDNSNTCNWYWSQSDGNAAEVHSSAPIIVDSYITTNNPSSSENSTVVATTSWVTGNFVANSTWNANIDQAVKTDSSPTFSSLKTNNPSSSENSTVVSTTSWVTDNFVSNSTWDDNINQAVLTTSSPTFASLKTNNPSSSENSTVVATTSWVTGNFVANSTWDDNIDQAVKTDSSPSFSAVSTETINSSSGTVNVNGTLQQSGSNVATQTWVDSNYVGSSTYSSDFYSSGNIINLAYGHRINTFTVTITSGTRVNYPQAFSANATSINMNSTQRLDLWVDSQDSSGFTVLSNTSTSQTIFVCAIGPK